MALRHLTRNYMAEGTSLLLGATPASVRYRSRCAGTRRIGDRDGPPGHNRARARRSAPLRGRVTPRISVQANCGSLADAQAAMAARTARLRAPNSCSWSAPPRGHRRAEQSLSRHFRGAARSADHGAPAGREGRQACLSQHFRPRRIRRWGFAASASRCRAPDPREGWVIGHPRPVVSGPLRIMVPMVASAGEMAARGSARSAARRAGDRHN